MWQSAVSVPQSPSLRAGTGTVALKLTGAVHKPVRAGTD
jgi:hypothetical protein